MRYASLASLAVAAVVPLACGPSPEEGTSSLPSLARFQTRLTELNTERLNGRTMNGPGLSGQLVGIRYGGARLGGARPVEKVQLDGTQLVGTLHGAHFQGSDFLGAVFTGDMEDGDPVTLRIQDIHPGTGPNADLSLYDVRYFDPVAGAWFPACQDAEGNPVDAVPVRGRWNYQAGGPDGGKFIDDQHSFTFACLNGAIGKCVLFGYRPWETFAGKSLAHYHQACTRMVRADYCGDGVSYTRTGYPINVYDRLGVQQDTEDWSLEAEWTPEGAWCFRAHNRAISTPSCSRQDDAARCDPADPFGEPEVLLVSEIQ